MSNLFSHRKGLKPVCKTMQTGDVDEELRNGLWNALVVCYWNPFNDFDLTRSDLYGLFQMYWHSYFKDPLDTLPWKFEMAKHRVRKYFFECPWNEVYDLIEFTANNGPDGYAEDFRNVCNAVLERENSAYRFVDKTITEITSPAEIDSIEEALADTSTLPGIRTHLTAALRHLSNRKHPDYRNSIKESISAVEGLARILSGSHRASLSDALQALEAHAELHGALRKGFEAIYGYTSDAKGIRHALLEDSVVTFADAKFMLVACSAFVNYVLAKVAESGGSLKGTT